MAKSSMARKISKAIMTAKNWRNRSESVKSAKYGAESGNMAAKAMESAAAGWQRHQWRHGINKQ
jgi:hypothetical protein